MATRFAQILSLGHVAADGSDPQTAYFSTGHLLAAAPDGSQWIPALEISDEPLLAEDLIQGRTPRPPSTPPTRKVRLRRWVGGVDRLAFLASRVIAGQEATLGSVGKAADGTSWTVSAPLVSATGRVVQTVRDEDYTDLTIRANESLHQVELPNRPLLGYRSGLLGDGSTAVVTTAYSTVATVGTMRALVLVPRIWDVTSTNKPTVWAQAGVWAYVKLTSSWKWTLCFGYSIDGGGTIQEIAGPEFEPDEDLHWLSWVYDLTSGASVRFGIDDTYSDGSDATAYVAVAGNWQLMRHKTTATTCAHTLMGAWMLLSSQLTDAENSRLNQSRATGGESGLVLFYPGDAASGTLYEAAAVNASAPYNGTITGAAESSLFEGPQEIASTPPLIFQGQQMPLVPVDEARLIYRAGKNPAEYIRKVLVDGIEETIERRYSVRDLISTAPGVGAVAVTGFMGGLLRFNALSDGAAVAADISGCGSWPLSIAMGSDNLSNAGSLPTSLNSSVTSGFVFDLFLTWADAETPGVTQTFFFSDWMVIGRQPTITTNTLGVAVSDTVSAIAHVYTFEWPQHSTLALRVEGQNPGGGGSQVRILINGKLVSKTTSANALGLAGGSTSDPITLGKFLQEPDYMGFLPMRLWGTGEISSTDAEAEAAQRAYLFENPSASDPNLVALWYRFTSNRFQIDDETGNGNHISLSVHATWQPGLCWADPLSASVYALTAGGMDVADITITEAAWQSIAPDAQSIWFTEPTPVDQIVARTIGPGYALIRADGTAVLGLIVEAIAGNAVGTITADEVSILGPQELEDLPPSRIGVEWGRIGAVQEAAAGATSDRRALMSREVREENVPVGSNATIYADKTFPAGRQLMSTAQYRDRAPSIAEAERLADVWEPERPMRPLDLIGGGRAVAAGEIWGVTDPKTGSVIYVVVMSRTTRGDREEWRVR